MIALSRALYNQPGFAEWRAANRNRHDLIFRRTAVDIPGIHVRLEDRRSDLQAHGVRYHNRLDAALPKIQVSARSSRPSAIRNAQDQENFLYALFYRWRELPADRRLKGQVVYYGLGAGRLELLPHVREEFARIEGDEEERLAQARAIMERLYSDGVRENLFTIESPDINAVAFEPDFSTVCEVGERTVAQILRDWPNDCEARHYLTSASIEEGKGDFDRLVTCYHLETSEYIYDVVGDLRDDRSGYGLQRRPNFLGRPWYGFAVGNETAESAPVERFQPLLGPIYPIVWQLEVVSTLLGSAALLTGRPVWQEVAIGARAATDLGDYLRMPAEERPVLVTDLLDKAVHKPRPGYQYINLPVPDARWLVEYHNQLERRLREYGFPPPLSPDQSLQAQASSGYHAAREQEQATLFIDPALDAINLAYKHLFENVLRSIQKIGVPVSIPVFPTGDRRYQETVTLRPDQIGEYDLTVSFSVKPATVAFAERESDTRLLQLGLMSRQTYMQRHYEDPVAEEQRIKLEQAAQSIDQMALEMAMRLLRENAGLIAEQEAEAAGIPSGLAPQSGGPAPGQAARFERPPVAMPGVGAPIQPAQQTPP